jgi:hypothetical protein
VFRNRGVSLALVGLFVWVTGCTSYKQIELAEVADHGKVRVTLVDGERETILDPVVEAGSIKGRADVPRTGDEPTPLAIPLVQVAELEAVGTNEVLMVLGLVLVVGTIIYAAYQGSACSQGGLLC